jgi:hypothetical protein
MWYSPQSESELRNLLVRMSIVLVSMVFLACAGLHKDVMQHADMSSATKANVSVDTIWQVQQTEQDTVFGVMSDALLIGAHVVTIDRSAQRLVILDGATGAVQQLFGRKGRGPTEFQELAGLDDGLDSLLLVRDRGNARLTGVRLRPARLDTVLLAGVAAVGANSSCRYRSGELLLAGAGPSVLTLFGSKGQILWSVEKTWPEQHALRLDRGQHLVGDGSTCVAVSMFGPGVVEYAVKGETRRARLRQDFGLPQEQQGRGGSTLSGGTPSAASACLLGAHLLVLRDYVDGRSQLVDFYRRSDFKYVGSVETTDQIFGIRCNGDRLLMRAYRDGLFKLALLRVAVR